MKQHHDHATHGNQSFKLNYYDTLKSLNLTKLLCYTSIHKMKETGSQLTL